MVDWQEVNAGVGQAAIVLVTGKFSILLVTLPSIQLRSFLFPSQTPVGIYPTRYQDFFRFQTDNNSLCGVCTAVAPSEHSAGSVLPAELPSEGHYCRWVSNVVRPALAVAVIPLSQHVSRCHF